MKIIPKLINKSKRHFCASGSILLPLAQKWGLVGVIAVAVLSTFGAQTASAASLTIEIPTNPLTVNASATLNDGFAEASGKVSVKGEAYWGYTLTIKAKDNSNDLVSKENIANKIASITEDASKANFPDNSWGYKFGKDNTNIESKNFQSGPTGETQIDKTDASGQHDYTFTIGTKVNENQPAGTYSNTFVLTVTAETVDYNITYNCKEGAVCPNQVGKSTEQSITLNSLAPTREGYEFQGYCTKEVLSEKICTSNSGTKYNPGDTYKLTKEGNNAMTLYAIWKPTTMQAFGNYCSALEMEKDILTLTDVRDNNTYTIAKLKDGKCWMTQDLRIVNKTLTETDSDLTGESFVLPESSAVNFSTTEIVDKAAVYINGSIGYYNWFTATAGEGTKGKTSGDTSKSICAKGWKLPTYNEFDTLIKQYTLTSIQQMPANFQTTSNVSSGGIVTAPNDMSCGFWWPSTAKTNGRWYLRMCNFDNRLSMYPNASGHGFPVRCIPRQ